MQHLFLAPIFHHLHTYRAKAEEYIGKKIRYDMTMISIRNRKEVEQWIIQKNVWK